MANIKIQDPITPRPLGNPRNGVRLFREDDDEMSALVAEIKNCDIKIDMLDVIRECVRQGLPAVHERWKPIIVAANKSKL